ncbi:MAG: hypothetical protein HDQ87_06705 [Clostridia bacterium]|nr:hypothetical protein [Clostridia bacterium]
MTQFWESIGIGVMILFVVFFLRIASKIGRAAKHAWKQRSASSDWLWLIPLCGFGLAVCVYAIGTDIIWCAESIARVLGTVS